MAASRPLYPDEEELQWDEAERMNWGEDSEEDLINLTISNPQIYKRGFLDIDNNGYFVRVTDSASPVCRVHIKDRWDCWRAFPRDEVVVQICETQNGKDYGRVAGILSRNMRPQYRTFLCMLNASTFDTKEFIPLRKGLPSFHRLAYPEVDRRGFVTISSFDGEGEPIRFKRRHKVDFANPAKYLYVVAYLKWRPVFENPLGIVLDVIPAKSGPERPLLWKDYTDLHEYTRETRREVLQIDRNVSQIFKSAEQTHSDLRHLNVFTIDSPGAEYLDDAFSIECRRGSFIVGIHVADVSSFVFQRSSIDWEASLRLQSIYSDNQAQQFMLPKSINEICSLSKGKERLVISVFITVSNKFELLGDPVIQKSRIISQHRLTYQKAEDLIMDNGSNINSVIEGDVSTLHRIAREMRMRRLGKEYFCSVEGKYSNTPQAYELVEEMMIVANKSVAKLLTDWFSTNIPLRCQTSPRATELEEWLSQYEYLGRNTFSLRRTMRAKFGQRCECPEICECGTDGEACEPAEMLVFRSALPQLRRAARHAARHGEFYELRQILGHYGYFPLQVKAFGAWKQIQETAKYSRLETEPLPHFEINTQSYTHFTSPIRRYFDLIVHRFATAMIKKESRLPYSPEEVDEICSKSTCKEESLNEHEERMQELLASESDGEFRLVYAVVKNPTESDKTVTFFMFNPKFRVFREAYQLVLNLNALDLLIKPEFYLEDKRPCLKLEWKLRMYDMAGLRTVDQEQPATVAIPIGRWREMLRHLAAQDVKNARMVLKQFLDENDENDVPTVQDQEDQTVVHHNKAVVPNHYQTVTLFLYQESIMEFQLLWKKYEDPTIQAARIRRDFTICIEHNSKPILCFSKPLDRVASKPQYRDPADYCDSWSRAIDAEAAYEAVDDGDKAFLHNVCVQWRNERNEALAPVFTLDINFCKTYYVSMSVGDYVCLKVNEGRKSIWIGHFLVREVREKTDDEKYEVKLRFHQTSVKRPGSFHSLSKNKCGIEWISRSVQARRMAAAVRRIKEGKTSELAKQIALGQRTAILPPPSSSRVMGEIRGLKEPNQGQARAIRMALSHRFSIIQGPPGTGKTITGVRLAVLFAEGNKDKPKRAPSAGRPAVKPQLMYCGPSNKSVDVVAEYFMKNLQNKRDRLKIVRVYGKMVERQDFPVPGVPVPPRLSSSTTKATSNRVLEPITLHHMIREGDGDTATELKSFDEKFANFMSEDIPEDEKPDITWRDIEEYLNLIKDASSRFIAKADIIFCTCVTAASKKLTESTNIKQVIIDEAAMCREPEAMIPIAWAETLEHVVLIGDHKQLQPIVKALAVQKDLGVSLFQRYADQELVEKTMLYEQHRMHRAVQEFPSAQFYHDKLREKSAEQRSLSSFNIWPGGRGYPIAFCHAEGEEASLPVSTAEGAEESKSNLLEATEVVRYAKYLVRDLRQQASQIVILSFYRSQCTEIQGMLEECPDCKEIPVFTVVKSQGSEWDYVLLTTVRSLPAETPKVAPEHCRPPSLGIVGDPHQINVAITRARKGLVIVGNKSVLGHNETWHNLMEHYEKQRAVVDAEDFMTGHPFYPVGMAPIHHS